MSTKWRSIQHKVEIPKEADLNDLTMSSCEHFTKLGTTWRRELIVLSVTNGGRRDR